MSDDNPTPQAIGSLVADLRAAADALETQQEISLAFVAIKRADTGMMLSQTGVYGSGTLLVYELERLKLDMLQGGRS